jgi:hypothetical protein
VANYVAAILIVAAVALFVAAPLSGGFPRRRGATSRELDLERLEHERGMAVQGLRELEFDHEMGKLDETDYRDLKRSLEDRALASMSALERLRGAERTVTMRLASRPAGARPAAVSASPQLVSVTSSAVPAPSIPRSTTVTESAVNAVAAPASAPVVPIGTPAALRSSGSISASRPVVNFCPQCGVPVGAGHNFCASCGANLNVAVVRIATRAE